MNPTLTALANRAGCKVVSIDYRLAPEHKFPAPLDDCYAALQWLAANGSAHVIDTSKLAVGGDSAGGNLAAAVALRSRDEKGPPLCFQLLVYPVTHHDFGTASYSENAEGYLLTKATMEWFWNHYLRDANDSKNPLVSPLLARDLRGLPPAVVYTAEFDPLRDEGEAYAACLTAAGVSVTLKRFQGQIHGFWGMPAVFPAAMEAVNDAAMHLRKAFA
jgi:acetyl esterase